MVPTALEGRVSCAVFSISETCYRYQAKLSTENAEIADWLLRLSATYKRWSFGLCYLYLCNIKTMAGTINASTASTGSYN